MSQDVSSTSVSDTNAAYRAFLARKAFASEDAGIEVETDALNPMLFEWQRLLVQWSLRKGRSALFEDCGLGKTAQQLEWAKHVCEHTGKDVLILAPLAVTAQTRR